MIVRPGLRRGSLGALKTIEQLEDEVVYFAHRGSAAIYPEETYTAYELSLNDKQYLLECDVQKLFDTSYGIMHDSTVDRTTTSTGNVNTFDAAAWALLQIDANTWQGSNYGNALPAPFMTQFVTNYKDRAILVMEDKDQISAPAIISELQTQGVPTSRAFIQSFDLADLGVVVSSGYEALYLDATGATDPTTVKAAGVDWAGIAVAASDAQLQGYVAANIKTTVYPVNRRYIRDEKLALGVTGFFSDDPLYLSRTSRVYSADQFADQTWSYGMLEGATDQGIVLAGRGVFTSPNYWGYGVDSVSTIFMSCLQGYLSPVAKPSNFTFDFKVTFDQANGGDATRWAAVCLSTDDRRYSGNSTTASVSGYLFLLRKNGTIAIYELTLGGADALLSQQTGTTISDGDEVSYRISVTPTSLSLSRLNGDGSVAYSTTSNDTTHRGGYIHLCRNQLACRFRELIVT